MRLRNALLCLMLLPGPGCETGTGTDISSRFPYREQVGGRYVVEVDQLDAYGIYAARGEPTVAFVVLLDAQPGIGGSEIAFRRRVPPGTILRLLSVWRQPVLSGPSNGIYYLVDVENWDLPSGVPVRLAAPDINPAILERLRDREQ